MDKILIRIGGSKKDYQGRYLPLKYFNNGIYDIPAILKYDKDVDNFILWMEPDKEDTNYKRLYEEHCVDGYITCGCTCEGQEKEKVLNYLKTNNIDLDNLNISCNIKNVNTDEPILFYVIEI